MASGQFLSARSVVARAKLWSSPWPSTRTSVTVVLGMAVAASVFAAIAQDHLSGWHFIGHSLVLRIIVATVAAMRGPLLQSWATASAALAVAVVTYYTVTRLFGPFDAYPSLAPLLLFWSVLAVVGGLGFAVLCHTALGRGWLRFLAVGIVAGLILGDAITTAIGIPYIEQEQPLAALGSISYPGPVFTVALVGATCWTLGLLIHHRRGLLTAWMVAPGLIVGYPGFDPRRTAPLCMRV